MKNSSKNRLFNLSEITSRIQEILQPHIGKQFWVKVEISSGRERGGSLYCDLVESAESGKTIAQMRCTIWNSHLTNIRKQVRQSRCGASAADLREDNFNHCAESICSDLIRCSEIFTYQSVESKNLHKFICLGKGLRGRCFFLGLHRDRH